MMARHIAKPCGYSSVFHQRLFYVAETGAQDEISQAFEGLYGPTTAPS